MSASAEEEDHGMPRRKRHAPEEIVAKLRQVEVLTGQGTPVADAIRAIGVTEATYRDELLEVEIFNSLREAQILIESWRRHFNTIRPHSALGYRPPGPEVLVPNPTAWPAAQPRPASPTTLPLVPRPALN
jgi:transposase InsO family protein